MLQQVNKMSVSMILFYTCCCSFLSLNLRMADAFNPNVNSYQNSHHSSSNVHYGTSGLNQIRRTSSAIPRGTPTELSLYNIHSKKQILHGLHLRQGLNSRTQGFGTKTQLSMVVTKSGGRPILSEEQFAIEVIDSNSNTENDDNDDTNDTSSSSKKTTNTDNNRPILVFYSAPWCGPCRLSNPVVKEIIKEFVPRIDVVEVCTDDFPEIAESAGVVSIPTIQLYHQGNLLETIVGCVAKNVLSSAVNKILEDLGLDFDGNEEEEELSS